MQTQSIDAATIERHMRHAHTIRSQAVLQMLSRMPAALWRTVQSVSALFT